MMFPLADTRLSWIAGLSADSWIALIIVCFVAWVVLRLGWGPSLAADRWGLLLLRGVVLAAAIAILLGPAVVDEEPGETSRPTLFYLFDGSQSMMLGGERTRWHDALDFTAQAERLAGAEHSRHLQRFRFGHRLAPLVESEQSESTPLASLIAGDAIPPADASDSRLADALRQLTSQVEPGRTAGVVVLSDGRVRATESVEQLADHFGQAGIPIHVVGFGESSGIGDVAVVSLVVEPRVRKFSENELTLFLRSFGFMGERTMVRVLGKGAIGQGEVVLAELPITLSGGAQSVSLNFRIEDRPEDLTIVVDPLQGELTDRNNRIEARVDIDRTKLRVLYIEGDPAAQRTLRGQGTAGGVFSLFGSAAPARPGDPGGMLNVRDALQDDQDIECVTVLRVGSSLVRVNENGHLSNAGLPRTRAEWFAYDCIVLSNIGADALEEFPPEQLALWIEGRGGGLIVTGTAALEPRHWDGTEAAKLLPIRTEQIRMGFPVPTEVAVDRPQHPIWRLRLEQDGNEQILAALPRLAVGATNVVEKPAAEVLARTTDTPSMPVIAAQRAGRGRVIVSTADLAGSGLTALGENWGPQSERVAGKLWRNLVYWATENSSIGRRRLIANADKRFYRPGEKISISSVAYDETARKSQKYNVWAMFEPMSLDDPSLYAPVLWPENVIRESGEVGPRIAWGEELQLRPTTAGDDYAIDLLLSEASGGDTGMRIELTAYQDTGGGAFDHGTQVDSTSLEIHVLSDPFEQQNPLPNHELLERVAELAGGRVLEEPSQLAELISGREISVGPPHRDITPAWSRWWLWLTMLGLLTAEWVWRRHGGLA